MRGSFTTKSVVDDIANLSLSYFVDLLVVVVSFCFRFVLPDLDRGLGNDDFLAIVTVRFLLSVTLNPSLSLNSCL